jgi:hypothetical protein
MGKSSRDLERIAYQQMKDFMVVALYLWVVFGLLLMFKSMVLAEQHIPFAYHGFAIINALALAKVMLTAKDLHLGERFNNAPLIYPTLAKSGLFSVVLACFKILEDAAIGMYHGQTFPQSISDLGGGTWKALLTLTLLLFVILIPFVGYGELQRTLGKGRLEQIFFHQRIATLEQEKALLEKRLKELEQQPPQKQ